MTFNIHSLALAVPHLRHPNRAPFRGVLTLVDSPSDRPPAGARGHRVLLTRAAAERALPSLLGMGLDFTASFDGHDVRRKVGIITAAEIVPFFNCHSERVPPFSGKRRDESNDPMGAGGFNDAVRLSGQSSWFAAHAKLKTENSQLLVHGYLFARDFPEVLREIRMGAGALGMSYEIAEARVRDLRDRIWIFDEVTFTGAAVLRRDKAAYSQTSIELITNHVPQATHIQEKKMNPELTQQFVDTTNRLAAAAESLQQALTRIDGERDALNAKVERIIAAVEENTGSADSRRIAQLEARIAELERNNSDLKARSEAARASTRKTLPPMVSALLAKNGLDASERMDLAALDKTLAQLSVEQRVAVKSQMAQAGLID